MTYSCLAAFGIQERALKSVRSGLVEECKEKNYIDDETSCVGHTEGLDEPGVVFSYMSYVRMLEANLPTLLDFFYSNIGYVG